MTLTFQPVRVAGEDGEGRLVLLDGALVALLVRLGSGHDGQAGRWFLEFGLGRLDGPSHPTFADLSEVEPWLHARLAKLSGPDRERDGQPGLNISSFADGSGADD